MLKFDISKPSTFCKSANAASDKGWNITLSVKEGLKAARSFLSIALTPATVN